MKYLSYITLGISLIAVASLAFLALGKKKPEIFPVNLDSPSEKTAEHQLISQALNDPDAVINNNLTESVSSSSTDGAALDPIKLSPDIKTKSQPAPELIPSSLDADVKNLYLSGASLRDDRFVDTSSSENLSVVRTLINKGKQSVE